MVTRESALGSSVVTSPPQADSSWISATTLNDAQLAVTATLETKRRLVKSFKKCSLTPQTKEGHFYFSQQAVAWLHTAVMADYVCRSHVMNAELQFQSEMFCAKLHCVICVCHLGFL